MKKLLMVFCLGSLSFAACNKQNDTNASADVATNDNTTIETATIPDAEARYRTQADSFAAKMGADMQFDTATQSRVSQVYYNRARRLAEIRGKYNNNNQSGSAAGTSTDTAGMSGELRSLNLAAETQIRSILKPEQYKAYEANRSAYQEISRDIKRDDEEIKVEAGDIKVKAEPGKSKVETSTYESKIKGDERKYKTDDVKIKSEPGKTKIKTDDVKIKIEGSEVKVKDRD